MRSFSQFIKVTFNPFLKFFNFCFFPKAVNFSFSFSKSADFQPKSNFFFSLKKFQFYDISVFNLFSINFHQFSINFHRFKPIFSRFFKNFQLCLPFKNVRFSSQILIFSQFPKKFILSFSISNPFPINFHPSPFDKFFKKRS